MLTWKLLLHVLIARNAHDNPIFVRETTHVPVWQALLRRLAESYNLRTVVVIGCAVAWALGVMLANNLLFALIPALFLLYTASGLFVGPMIVEEHEKLCWEPLLTTPYSLDLIVLGKMGGALWHIRQLIYGIMAPLLVLAAGVGLISLILIPVGPLHIHAWNEIMLCGTFLIVPLLGAAVFMIDRMQQFLLTVMAATAAGVSATSVRNALSTSSAAVLLTWLIEIVATEAMLVLYHGEGVTLTTGHLLALATLGPVVNFIVTMSLGSVIIHVASVLIARELLMNALWWWILRRARG